MSKLTLRIQRTPSVCGESGLGKPTSTRNQCLIDSLIALEKIKPFLNTPKIYKKHGQTSNISIFSTEGPTFPKKIKIIEKNILKEITQIGESVGAGLQVCTGPL